MESGHSIIATASQVSIARLQHRQVWVLLLSNITLMVVIVTLAARYTYHEAVVRHTSQHQTGETMPQTSWSMTSKSMNIGFKQGLRNEMVATVPFLLELYDGLTLGLQNIK